LLLSEIEDQIVQLVAILDERVMLVVTIAIT
jgi:hypothetical protein